MNFRLLFLATLLMLGVASVCAGNQPNQYTHKVNQGTLIYYPHIPGAHGKTWDQLCFVPSDSRWNQGVWGLKFSWNNNSRQTIYLSGTGYSCVHGGNHPEVFQSITTDRGVDIVEFIIEGEYPQSTRKVKGQQSWFPSK
ncbi:hypothetical protein ACQY0O_003710 [Thecaphora frezii]